MAKSLEMLYTEHDVIINAVGMTEPINSQMQTNPDLFEKNMRQMVHFIKHYAGHYHHNKEETILLPATGKKSEVLEDVIIKGTQDHHVEFKEMIEKIEKNLDLKEYDLVQKNVKIYVDMLLDHIAV